MNSLVRLFIALALMLLTLAAPAAGAPDGERDGANGGAIGPLQVFILAGQSNMQGHAHVRTFGAMRADPDTAAILDEMCDADGTPCVSQRTWISSIGSGDEEQVGPLTAGFGAKANGPKIGPEFTFGLTMERRLSGPILIIKTAWGGKSLHTDFRPPSAGPYELNEAQLRTIANKGEDVEAAKAERTAASGRYYRLMLDHIKMVLADIPRVCPDYDPAQGYELAGFIWFQGWNDMVESGVYPERGKPGGYDAYSELLAQLIRDVRADLAAPTMPVVIGVMGVGGPIESFPAEAERNKEIHRSFRQAMAAPATLPEFVGTVVAVPTAACWDMELVALRDREGTIRPKAEAIEAAMKEGTMSKEEGTAAVNQLYSQMFTAREMLILRESTSNQEYHYLGSARIMSRIGKSFADALAELRKGKP